MNTAKNDIAVVGDTLDVKIRDACHRIEDLYNETKGNCIVSFSGGKDSTVLLALIKMCIEVYTLPPEGIRAVYSETGLELGATSKFVRECKKGWYKNIEIIRPEHSFDWCVKNYGKPMKSKLKSEYLSRWQRGTRTAATIENLFGVKGKMRKARIADRDIHMLSDNFDIKVSGKCCDVLKKKPFVNYEKEKGIKGNILGVRMYEGGVRETQAKARVKEGSLCTVRKANGMITKFPIIDWTDEDVEDFIRIYNVPLSEAYTVQGYDRTGCFLCPFSKYIAENLERLNNYEPTRYKAAMYWLKDVYIAQDVILPFDKEYEKERKTAWEEKYEQMRQEMLKKYRPNSRLIKKVEQLTIFDYLGEKE